MNKVKALSRGYAPAIAGRPDTITMKFDAASCTFDLVYQPIATAASTVTEVFANQV